MALPQPFRVEKCGIATPCDPHGLDDDPRGLVFCWEAPMPRESYVVACDPQ